MLRRIPLDLMNRLEFDPSQHFFELREEPEVGGAKFEVY